MQITSKPISRRDILKSASAGAGVMAFAGCVTENDGSGSDELGDELTIGWIHAMSGPFAHFGEDSQQGLQLAVGEINDSDEYLPDTELVIEEGDSQTAPEVGLNEARRLNEQVGVDIFAGTTTSSSAASIANYASEANIPFFIDHSAAASLTGEDCQYTTVRAATHTELAAVTAAQFLVDELNPDTVYTLVLDYAYGQAVQEAINSVFDENGVEVIGEAQAPLGNEDFSTIINDILDADPDAILQGMNGAEAIPFLNQSGDRGLDIPMVHEFQSTLSIGRLTEDQFDQLGPQYRGAIRYSTEIDTGWNQEFVDAYMSDYDEVPDWLAAGSYANAYFYSKVITDTQSLATEDVIDTANSMTFDSIFGEIEMRECDNQGMGKLYTSEITGIDTEYKTVTENIIDEYDESEIITPCEESACSFD